MKKWSYLLVGVLVGAVFATAGNAFADQIKTLVGQTVAGEYRVKVNGSALANSAIVVDGKAHVPLREVSDSMGAGVSVNGKTIEITTETNVSSSSKTTTNDIQTERFKKAEELGYEGDVTPETEKSLSEYKKTLENTLANAETSKKNLQDLIDTQTAALDKYPSQYERRTKKIEDSKIKMSELDTRIAQYKDQIADLDARLETLNKILNQ